MHYNGAQINSATGIQSSDDTLTFDSEIDLGADAEYFELTKVADTSALTSE